MGTRRRRMRCGNAARMRGIGNAHKITVGRSEGKTPLDKLGWEDNSITDLKKEQDVRKLPRSVWPRIGSNDGLL
jgi:hypothetical protein